MKFRTGLVAIAAAGLILTACGSDDETTTGGLEAPPADTTATLKVWLMDGSQPPALLDEANATFKEKYPNVTVQVELQQWGGIQDKLTTSLATDSSPDIVEIGNTLTAKYIDAGLLADLTSVAGDLGVANMLPGLQASGELDGARSGIPYYGAVRIVIYKKSDFEEAGITAVPTSMAELEEAAQKLADENSDNSKYSAFFFPGKDWYSAAPFVWDAGGEIATQDGSGSWTGTLNSDASQAGLTTLKNLVDKYSKAPTDSDETKNVDNFNTGNVGMFIDRMWTPGGLDAEGQPFAGDIGAFALPGTEAGSTAPAFLGGSDLAVSERSPNKGLAVEWLKIMTGTDVQTKLARDAGFIPNQEAAFVGHEGNEFLLIADEASKNSKFTPVSPYWGNVETKFILQDMLVEIFSGQSEIDEATAAADTEVTTTLNGG